MSREILFKAKRLDNGEWVEGYYFERRNTCGEIIASVIISDAYEQVAGGVRYFRSNLNYECFKVDPSTLCQYTGLTDKNGNKIWENDVVSEDFGNYKGAVVFGGFASNVLNNLGFNIDWSKSGVYYRQDLPFWADNN